MPVSSALWLSLRYAATATLLAWGTGITLAWLLVHRKFQGSAWLEAAASLPIVLPPAVLTYYLIAALGRWRLRFSWHGALALSAIYTFPLMLRMARLALANVDPAFENAARTLGAGEWRTFWRVTLPLSRRGLLAAAAIGFARAFADLLATAVVSNNASAAWLLVPLALALAALSISERYAPLADSLRR